MTHQDAASDTQSQEQVVNILNFYDGPVYTIYDPKMEAGNVFYHPATGALLYGGDLIQQANAEGQDVYIFCGRVMGVCEDRTSFTATFIALSVATAVLTNSEETANHMESLTTQHAVRAGKSFTFKVRIENGTPMYAMPPGPWTANTVGILDGRGRRVFERVGAVREAPAPITPETRSFFAGLRDLFKAGK